MTTSFFAGKLSERKKICYQSAYDTHIPKIRAAHPEVFSRREEEGTIERATSEIAGEEVVTRSSKRPLIIQPGLGVSRRELAQNRADTHTKLEHATSKVIAHLTGPVSGVVDGALNGVAEIGEDLAFGIAKTVFGLKHGWERGRSQIQDDN